MLGAKGQSGAPAPLRRNPYHISVHPEGEGFALRSKSNVLTIYGGDLQVDFETDLERTPEVAANRDRLGLAESEAHRALRCVALTPERDRYLFTYVDEAWCISRDGEHLWGLRMPANEPTRIRLGGLDFGTAAEIDEALEVMGLEMPVTPDEIRKRYRQLAREVAKRGIRTPRGNRIDKKYLYRMLNNCAYIGEAVHKGNSYPGEHDAIIDRETWDRVHTILQESPRKRAAHTRAETPALLKGLLFGPDGAVFRQPEIVAGTWKAARSRPTSSNRS